MSIIPAPVKKLEKLVLITRSPPLPKKKIYVEFRLEYVSGLPLPKVYIYMWSVFELFSLLLSQILFWVKSGIELGEHFCEAYFVQLLFSSQKKSRHMYLCLSEGYKNDYVSFKIYLVGIIQDRQSHRYRPSTQK